MSGRTHAKKFSSSCVCFHLFCIGGGASRSECFGFDRASNDGCLCRWATSTSVERLDGSRQVSHAAGHLQSEVACPHALLVEVQQFADAVLHLLSRRLCNPWHQRRRFAWAEGLPRVHQASHEQCVPAVPAGQAVRLWSHKDLDPLTGGDVAVWQMIAHRPEP